jgi:hypothetical protein
MRKSSFKEILAERQEYLDELKKHGDMYALGFLETSFLYNMGDNGLEPLNPSQLNTLEKWKATNQC